jgi:hypothetical protein
VADLEQDLAPVFTCTATEAVGDLVYQTGTDNTVAQADASDSAKRKIAGWIVEKPSTTTCRVSTQPGPVTSGSGMTAGNQVYLSSDTPGGVTETDPGGFASIPVGIAASATTYTFDKDLSNVGQKTLTQTVELAVSQTNFAADGSNRVLIFGSPASIPAGVDFLANFKSDFVPQQAVGTPDTTAEVNVSINNGRLDNTGGTGSAVQSYLRYDGSDGNFDGDTGQHITVRVLWSPNYNGIPSGHTYHIFRSSLSITGRDLFIQHYDDAGTERLRAYCTNSSGTVIGSVQVDFEVGVDYNAGDIFEIEYTMDSFGTDFASLFVDGTRVAQSLAVIAGWLDNNTGRYIQLGGAGGTTGVNQANHFCHGVAIFNPAIRVDTDSSYTPAGLPDEGTGTETINIIGGAGRYVAGDVVRFITMDGRVEFAHNANPQTNRTKMLDGANWAPAVAGEWIDFERTAAGAWEEIGRSSSVTAVSASGSVSTTDATATTIDTFTTTTDKSYVFSGHVVGRQTNGAGETGTYRVEGWVKNVSGTVTQALTLTVLNEDVPAWNVTMIVSGSDVELQIAGDTGDDVDWSASVQFLEA